MVLNRVCTGLMEVTATVLDLVLPQSISRRVLQQTDHFAPHPGTGFEGWYTRIQGEDFSIAIIMCSLADKGKAFDRQHYLHFSIIPLKPESSIKERIDLHLFPRQMISTVITSGQLPFTLDAPGFGVFNCHPHEQTYDLTLHDEANNCIYTVEVRIRDRIPLDDANLNQTPHGSVARLESTLPLHWAIFSTSSTADVTVKKSTLNAGVASSTQTVLKGTGRAHMEKNWGVSFPQGWTWSQASSAPIPGKPAVSLALAGGMILGNKAFMVHYRSPSRTWMFAPPFTIIGALPNLWALLRNSLKRNRGVHAKPRSLQWGPFASESFDNVNGALNVSVQTLRTKLVIKVQSSDAPSEESWLALYCPLPGGHSTTAYETFTATMRIQAYHRRWLFGSWEEVESHILPDSALEFGGQYWRQLDKGHSD